MAADFGTRRAASFRLKDREVVTTPVFDALFYFATERQHIFSLRLAGETEDLTTDPVLQQYKFTNAYRASDRVSQYLIRQVIYRSDLPQDAVNVFYRTILFKLFNHIATWEFLEQRFGPLVAETFDVDAFAAALDERMRANIPIYSGAYIMPPSKMFGTSTKHVNHLRLLKQLLAKNYPERLAARRSLSDAYQMLHDVPSLGPFLAFQYAIDLNYGPVLNFDENSFVVAGTGALDGISKCFVGGGALNATAVIAHVCEHQDRFFAERGLAFRNLWGRPLQLIDCQNLFCEISKYSRAAFPEIVGSRGKTKIKQTYKPSGPLLLPWYPPKWGINDEIAGQLAATASQAAA